MGYSSRHNRRPMERASKDAHSNVVKDEHVASFLKNCTLPKLIQDVDIDKKNIVTIIKPKINPIKFIVAVDGGYTLASVRKEYPSAKVAFFQFGPLYLRLEDLDAVGEKAFIDPEDIQKLKEIQRFKLALPIKNIILEKESTLTNSVRKSICNFFSQHPAEDCKFIDTLQWLIFEDFDKKLSKYTLSNCPSCQQGPVDLNKKDIAKDYSFKCPKCGEKIFLIDVFRLHEAIDDELGAEGILGYLTVLLEQMIVVHLIRVILDTQPSLLEEGLFIKDGPLAFFGQTANMHKPVRNLMNHLMKKHNIYFAGIEKSGAFVEHAFEIASKIRPGEALLLSNDYIYKHILPGCSDDKKPYARTSYYGTKLIFKTNEERIYVITLPTQDEKVVLAPRKEDFKNIDVILSNIERLKCDMYDSALIPVAIVNKLVSLSNHPSSVILEKFAKKQISTKK